MRYLFSLLLVLLFVGATGAEEPVKWSISAKASGDAWDLILTATIEKGWSVYSQNNYGDMGPWPTSVKVDSVAGRTLLGTVSETGPKVIEGMDAVFGMEVKKFKEQAIFTQRIKVDDPNTPVTGMFEYMTCNDEM
ncbi:MAG TPA: protein-disulfide reductase DsbD family protein, partial [Flavobacteriales bacterium]|nr:protein-disulfide reductase DsbD family protein [Flavobacteriales bacterium]